MDALTNILSLAAMFSPIVALGAALAVYLNNRNAVKGGPQRSVILFALGALAVGGIVGCVGVLLGIELFCSWYQNAQCGLGGVFFAGPLSFSLAVGAYLYFWVKRGKAP